MKAFLFRLAFALAKIALKTLLSRDVKQTIYDAIDTAEREGGDGETKMRSALSRIKTVGPAVLREKADTHLRTIIELALDNLL